VDDRRVQIAFSAVTHPGDDRGIAPLLIRHATASDLPALREVFRRSSLSNEADRALLAAKPELLDLADTAVREGRTRVAVIDDQVVGFASTATGDAVELEDLFVDPDRMREGIGRALVEDVVAAARRANRTCVEVDANRHALAFYENVGFARLGEVTIEHGTAVRMRLDARGPGGALAPRRAARDEADAVARVWLRSRRAAVPRIPPPVHSDIEVHQWFAHVVLVERETWVIEEGGSLIAVLVLEPGWVDQLYVDPDHTGRGLGSLLVELAKGRQPEGLDLWTFAANTGARRFYERHGFEVVGGTEGDNEEGAPDVRYQWSGG
jgi:GNAT superfamily N-acetyltransferase